MTKRITMPKLELHVVLDTNALFTGSAHFLFRKEVADLIQQNSNLLDISIRWIIPDVVRHERQFQMMQEATQMLPTIQKLERLLGHNLNITKDILEERVANSVDRQIQEHRIVVQALNSSEVDWQRVVLDAAYRKPPFQSGEKEKGFRDTLILESFIQTVNNSPSTRASARVILVSGDQLLRDAAAARLMGVTNVHILESTDALKGLINTLGSAVDEKFIENIKQRAAEAFFKANNEDTLYYKANVSGELHVGLAKADLRLPSGANKYTVEKWVVGSTSFVKKERQRVYWTTRLEARLKALKTSAWLGSQYLNLAALAGLSGEATAKPSLSLESSGSAGAGEWTMPLSSAAHANFLSTGIYPNLGEDQVVGWGTATLDASWGVAVTTSGKLTSAKFDGVKFVDVIWAT